MKKKIGILGLGSIGSRHLSNFKELECEVRGYDPEYDHTLTRDRIIKWADAIVIASPTNQHSRDIIDVDCAGKPMLVEKPLTGEIEYVIPLHFVKMVGYNLRFHSCVKKARAWLGEGKIGKPLWARFTCGQYNDKPSYRSDGVILNWSHELDLALFLLGGAEMVAAAGPANGREDLVDIILRHDKTNCQTVVHLDYLTKFERRGFLIVGTDGAIECDLVMRQTFLRDNTGSLPEIYYGRDSFDKNYMAEARAFLDRLDGKDVDGCTADEAMCTVGICLRARELIRG
jgi:predicted dehydrogenase